MFKSSLEQERIFEEIKNGTGNLLINALAGTGKCLGKGTMVLMYNGFFKKVEDIVEGDILMGDDGTPRNVLNTNVGYDDLYKISIIRNGESFICNEDHILTCIHRNNKLDIDLNKVDISVKDLIGIAKVYSNNKYILKTYYLYRSVLDYKGSEINDFYNYGYNFFKIKVKHEDILTTIENRYLILSGLIDKYFYPLNNILVLDLEYSKKSKKMILLETLLNSLSFEYVIKDKFLYIRKGFFNKLTLKNEDKKNFFFPITYRKRFNNKELFSITKLNKKGYYYGFTLNGNGRFIIKNYIVTHNTTTIVKSLELIPEDKRVLMLAFNKHIANELRERLPKRDNLWISTTHSLGWNSIKKKYKNALLDDYKAINVINSKLSRWNMSHVDNVEEYVNTIKKLVDLCRLTLTLQRNFIPNLANKHGLIITDEDARRVLSVIEEMYNDTDKFDFIDMVYLPAIDKKLWLYPNDYVFVDECVFGLHRVITDKGRRTIENLYNEFKELKPGEGFYKVLSFNVKTNEKEYKDITNVMYKGEKMTSKISFTKNVIHCTSNHLLYTLDGWREAKDLNVGDFVYTNDFNKKTRILPTREQLELLQIMYLNDYDFSKNVKTLNTGRYRFYILNKNVPYYNLIDNLLAYTLKSYLNLHYTEYQTSAYYVNDKIKNKEYILKNLSNMQLAFLLMRNYSFDENDNIGFAINGKTYDRALIYKNLLEESTGLNFNMIINSKTFYYHPIDIDEYMSRVGKYITNDYLEVFPEKYHKYIGGYVYKKPDKIEYGMVITHIKHNNRVRPVYDITVSDNNNYFLSNIDYNNTNDYLKKIKTNTGILVHNCQDYNRAQQFILNKVIKKDTGRLISVGDNNQKIYFFMGSDSNSFDWFRERENTKVLPLTTSYRCSKNVIRYAQNLVPDIKYKVDAVEGSVRNGSVLEEAEYGDFILSRKNKPLVVLLFDLLRNNKNASIRGNDTGVTIAKTVNKYKDFVELNNGLNNLLEEKRNQLNNLGVADILNDPRYVALLDNVDVIRFLMGKSKSIQDIIKKLSLIFTDTPKGIILSTIHKSKGLEADNVFIIKPDLIKLPSKSAEMWEQEGNLEYIAYTRAKVNLILDTEWTDEDR
jgi:superfamily I DNA/RNA helicase